VVRRTCLLMTSVVSLHSIWFIRDFVFDFSTGNLLFLPKFQNWCLLDVSYFFGLNFLWNLSSQSKIRRTYRKPQVSSSSSLLWWKVQVQCNVALKSYFWRFWFKWLLFFFVPKTAMSSWTLKLIAYFAKTVILGFRISTVVSCLKNFSTGRLLFFPKFQYWLL